MNAQRESNMNPIIRRTGLFVSVVMVLGMTVWGSSSAQGAVDDGKSPAASVLTPQMIVTPVPSGSLGACRSQALLRELQAHMSAGEKNEARALLQNQDCMALPEQGLFRIVTVQGGLVEFVLFTSRSPRGYWTAMESMKPLK
jgi:hypothetical protein